LAFPHPDEIGNLFHHSLSRAAEEQAAFHTVLNRTRVLRFDRLSGC
jgi:hypothetical protein